MCLQKIVLHKRSVKKLSISALVLVFLLSDVDIVASLQSSEQYDFIIVGGGTAGCLLAARLSEVPEWNVLLLEAGAEENIFMRIPFSSPLFMLSPYAFQYFSRGTNDHPNSTDRGLFWPQAKVLGGGSSINCMITTRGNRRDFDHWKELGNTGWGYDEVLPYFKKFEKMLIPKFANDTNYHSTQGELPITFPSFHSKITEDFLKAGVEKGYAINDVNGENEEGFSTVQTTTRNGERVSSYRAFLEPVKHRPNLHIKTNSMVTKILVNSNNSAYGVEFMSSNRNLMRVQARKEIIISAGSLNSAKLLMLSGIGPEAHLKELNIPIVKDSKVGENLRDQIQFSHLYFTVNQSVDLNFYRPFKDISYLTQYILKRNGPFGLPCGFEAAAFIDLEHNGYPQMEFAFANLILPSIPFYLLTIGAKLTLPQKKALFAIKFKHGFTVPLISLRPHSVGKVLLKDKDPFSEPIFYPYFFSDPRDAQMLVKAVRFLQDLIKTAPLQKYGTVLHKPLFKPCDKFQSDSDEYWECFIKQMSTTSLHTVGTCKMGPDSDLDAVVDPRLRVRGVKNLRVADNSIMPTVTTGHTMTPAYMIAEKAADMIKEDNIKV